MADQDDVHAINAHYRRGDLAVAIVDALRAAGKNPHALEPDDLAPVDQFHLGGKAAAIDSIERGAIRHSTGSGVTKSRVGVPPWARVTPGASATLASTAAATVHRRMVILAALRTRPPVMLRRQTRSLVDEMVWVLAAAVLGFATTALFSGLLEVQRDWFVTIYALLVGSFLYGYMRWSGLDLRSFLLHRWIWGVIGMVVVGAILVASVQRMPASPPASGVALAWDILWLGIVYGVVDALLLTVLPVAVTWRAFSTAGWTAFWPGKIAAWAVAFAASLGVTAAYHLGYVEFRGPQVVDPLIGNGVMTLGTLLTGSPLTAIGAHVALHVASVLHGVETTVTLPPHY